MITKMPFGRTGHNSSRTIFGAAALSQVTQREADETLQLLLEYGINHIDTAASYGDAELRLGPWMQEHRQRFFLATKTEARTYDDAKRELYRSLERMHTESIDLWQMHILVDRDEWEVAMGPGGALEAFVEAQEEELVRFLGVTGHGVNTAAMHLRSLERFDFDAVLLPYNYTMMQNPRYARDFESLLDLCADRSVAVQTIKTVTRRPWGDRGRSRSTWYEPLEDQEDIDAAVHWAMHRSQIFLNTVADVHLLPRVLNAAARFEPGSLEELEHRLADLNMEPLFT